MAKTVRQLKGHHETVKHKKGLYQPGMLHIHVYAIKTADATLRENQQLLRNFSQPIPLLLASTRPLEDTDVSLNNVVLWY